MGKYDGTTEFETLCTSANPLRVESEKWSVLVSIANELAEANRLKRLELSHFITMKINKCDNIKSDSLLPKELEDQA